MPSSQAATIGDLVNDWNGTLEHRREAASCHNLALWKQVENGEVEASAALEGLLPIPERITPPAESWCKWFRQVYGWSLLGRSTENAQWLPYQHPDMVAARAAIQALMTEKGCHGGMLLNVDQVWRRAFDNKTRFMHKSRESVGARGKRRKASRTIDKKAHFVQGSRRSVTVSWQRYLTRKRLPRC